MKTPKIVGLMGSVFEYEVDDDEMHEMVPGGALFGGAFYGAPARSGDREMLIDFLIHGLFACEDDEITKKTRTCKKGEPHSEDCLHFIRIKMEVGRWGEEVIYHLVWSARSDRGGWIILTDDQWESAHRRHAEAEAAA